MKKFTIILILLLTACTNNKIEEENIYEKLGYNSSQISIINTLNDDNKDFIKNNDYNKTYIDIINSKSFDENNFKKYVKFLETFELEYEDIIFIVNNKFDNLDNYNKDILDLMKSKYYIHSKLNRYLDYKEKNKINDANIIIQDVNSNIDYDYYTNQKKTDLSKGYLILVNKYNYLENDYIPDNLVKISSEDGNGFLEEKTYENFKKMKEDALKENVYLYASSPYRSYQTQSTLYNRYVNRDGKTLADTYSARPGNSEHQTGLALDITRYGGNLIGFENTNEFKWLEENCYNYGFILRYPKNKTNLTGYQYESWHYRYVGIDVAKKIKEENITFEEYYAYYVE